MDNMQNICEYDILHSDVIDETYSEILEKLVTKILALSSVSITNLTNFTEVFRDLMKYFKKIKDYSSDSAIVFYDFVVCSIIRHYYLNVISKVSLFSGTEFQKKHLANHIHNCNVYFLLLNGIMRIILKLDKEFCEFHLNNIDNLSNCMLNISILISQIILILFQTYFARENADILNTFFDDIKCDSLIYVQCIELIISLYNNNYLKKDIKNSIRKNILRCFDFKGFDVFLHIAFKAKDSPEYDDIIRIIRHIYEDISKIIFGRPIYVLMDQKFIVWGLLEYIDLENLEWAQIQYKLWLPPLFISSWLIPNGYNDCEFVNYCYKFGNQISRVIIDNIRFKIISSSPELSFQISMSFIFCFQLDEITSDQSFIIKRVITLLDNIRRTEFAEQMNLLMVSKYQCLHFFSWLWESSLKCSNSHILTFSDEFVEWSDFLVINFLFKNSNSIASEFEHLVIFVLTGGKIDNDKNHQVYERGFCKNELDRSLVILKRLLNSENWSLYLDVEDVKTMFILVLTELLRWFKKLCSLSILVSTQEKSIIEFVLFIFLDYDRDWIEFQCWNNLIYFLHSVSKDILTDVFAKETLSVDFSDKIVKKYCRASNIGNTFSSNSKTLKLFSRIMYLICTLTREFKVLNTLVTSGECEAHILNLFRKIIGINQFLIIILIYLPPGHMVNQYICSQYEFISLLSSSVIDIKYILWFQTVGKFLDHLLTNFISTNLQLFAILSRQGISNINMPNNLKFSRFIEIMVYGFCRLDIIAGVILDLIKIYKDEWKTDSTDVICLAMSVIRSIRFFDKCDSFLINKINDTIHFFRQINGSIIWELISSDIQNMEFSLYVLNEILHGYLCIECYSNISFDNLSDKKKLCEKCTLIPTDLQLGLLHLAKLCISENAPWIIELKAHLVTNYLRKIYDIAFESKTKGYEILYEVLIKIIPPLDIKKPFIMSDHDKYEFRNEITSTKLFKLLELDVNEQILAIVVL
ncbi:hypothetical protein PORY_000261 [Pneumocystis oryctolagi]|uniref:Uncharacterized protein n=1 Tax=Pneumocystis oryctolagi TaxID=42067 RepID=A0ACB7CGL8_9ASCO|nr:hypothetical protein PORY_000261 [Pneumocystis oryctolagi]